MNNTIKKYDQLLSLTDRFNSAPAGEVLTSLVKESSISYPRTFTKIESALSSGTAALTSPLHIFKDLFLAAIAAPFACVSSSAKTFAVNRSITAGVDAVALFAGIVGLVYPFTPLPGLVRKKVPQLNQDIPTVVSEGIQKAMNIVTKDQADNILKIGEWVENNQELSKDIFQEIKQLKPLIPLLPDVKQILEEAYSLQNKENVLNMLIQLEKINSASCVGIISAILKNHSSKHGKVLRKIDSGLSFGLVSLTSPLQVITHLFLAVVSAPFTPFSERSKAFCATQLFKVKLSSICFAIGLIGLFNPTKAEKLFTKTTINYLPKKWQKPAENFWNSLLTLNEKDLKKILKSLSKEKLKNQFSNVLPKLVQVSQKYPDGVNHLIELAGIIGLNLPEGITGSIAPLVAELATLEEKHPGVIQNATEIVMNEEWQKLPELFEKHPDLTQDIIQMVEEKEDLAKTFVEMPALKEALPPELAKDIPNVVKDGIQIVKEYPQIIPDLLKLQNEENQFNEQTLEEMVKKYPGLEEKIQNTCFRILKTMPA